MLVLVMLEWKSLWRSRTLPLCLLCWMLLTAMALTITIRSSWRQQTASAAAAAADYNRWLLQGQKYAHAAAHYGMYAFRPVFGTAMVEPGVTDYVGQFVYLEAHVQDPTVYRPADDNADVLRLGDVTPAWLCNNVLPLLLIVLGFASFAGDRVQGTLRLSLVQSRSTYRLLSVRTLAIFLVGVGAVVLTVGPAWIASQVLHMPQPAHALSRWCLLFFMPALGVFFWSAVSVGISAFSRTPSASLVIALTVWLMLGMVLPRAVMRYAAALAPTPTHQQLALQIREATGEGEDSRSEERLQQRLLAFYGVARVEALPVNLDGVRREAAEEAGDVVFDRFWGFLFHQYQQQQRTLQNFSWLSPVLANSLGSEMAASTDVQAYIAFVHQAEEHRRLIQRTMNQELARKRDAAEGPRPNSGPELWAKVPAFHFSAEKLNSDGHVLTGRILLALAVQCAASATILALAARHLQKGKA